MYLSYLEWSGIYSLLDVNGCNGCEMWGIVGLCDYWWSGNLYELCWIGECKFVYLNLYGENKINMCYERVV